MAPAEPDLARQTLFGLDCAGEFRRLSRRRCSRDIAISPRVWNGWTTILYRPYPQKALKRISGANCAASMVTIADTGFIVALRGKSKSERDWSRTVFQERGAPLLTCEAVLTEAAHLLSSEFIARLVKEGDLKVSFEVQQQIQPVWSLLKKYKPRMDFADACIIRMTELFPACEVLTVDKSDFTFYRRFGSEPVPAIF